MRTDERSGVTRRGVLRGVSAAAGVAASTGAATAQEGTESASEKPDFGSWLGGVDGGYEDLRGNDEVTVEVGAEGNGGNLAFSPAGVWVDTGTTITWEWVDGRHNVVAEEGPASLDSGDPETDATYEYTVESGGITSYYCEPHLQQGMKGAVAVGDDVPTVAIEEDTGVLPASAKAMGVAGTATMGGALGLGYLLVKYGGR